MCEVYENSNFNSRHVCVICFSIYKYVFVIDLVVLRDNILNNQCLGKIDLLSFKRQRNQFASF